MPHLYKTAHISKQFIPILKNLDYSNINSTELRLYMTYYKNNIKENSRFEFSIYPTIAICEITGLLSECITVTIYGA